MNKEAWPLIVSRKISCSLLLDRSPFSWFMLTQLTQVALGVLPYLPYCGQRGTSLSELFLLGILCFLVGVVVGGIAVACCISGKCRYLFRQLLVVALEEREIPPVRRVEAEERGLGRLVRYRG